MDEQFAASFRIAKVISLIQLIYIRHFLRSKFYFLLIHCKFTFNTTYSKEKFNAGIALTRFSEITLIDFADTEDNYSAKTDVFKWEGSFRWSGFL